MDGPTVSVEVMQLLATVNEPAQTEAALLAAVFASVPALGPNDIPYQGTSTGYNVYQTNSVFVTRPLFVAERALTLAGLADTDRERRRRCYDNDTPSCQSKSPCLCNRFSRSSL